MVPCNNQELEAHGGIKHKRIFYLCLPPICYTCGTNQQLYAITVGSMRMELGTKR
jgi:hypothetical protein